MSDNQQQTAKLNIANNINLELPVLKATIGQDVIDIKSLAKQNMWSYDPGFMATASCESKITYIDGDKGELSYRGYPIEDLAHNSNHLEGAYLLLNGELPTKHELAEFETAIKNNGTVDPLLVNLFKGFKQDAHPMAMLTAAVGALASYNPTAFNFADSQNRSKHISLLLGQIPAIVAMCYRHNMGQDFISSNEKLSYAENFLTMVFADNEDYKVDPVIAKVFDRILLLHADHEQNASTSTVRMAGSSGTHPYAAIAAGVACLWGPAHGGANEAVLKMLNIIGDESNVESYINDVKNKKFRLMGFGHRVYKNKDPRAKIMQESCHEVLDLLGKHDDKLFKLAMKLEKIALSDPYFIEKKLYPNVDFYSGIILKAIGIPTNMFTAVFTLARTAGWLAQWQEMITEEGLKISRPRQLYTGYTKRDYCAIESRGNAHGVNQDIESSIKN